MHVRLAVLGSVAISLVLAGDSPPAKACGCLSPPAVTEGEYAVNQSAEQIIFEVERCAKGSCRVEGICRVDGDPITPAQILEKIKEVR